MGVFLFFVDGFGLGTPDPERNPVFRARLPVLSDLMGGPPGVAFEGMRQGAFDGVSGRFESAVVPVDASLGVPGLPQSATGQTTIMTGANAPKAVGRHINAHPTPTLAQILNEKSIFRQVSEAGLSATFLNAYRPEFFAWYSGQDPKSKYRPSASTRAVAAAGLPFRTLDDLLAGRAVYHDITHWWLRERGYDVPMVTPEEAGRRAAAVAGDFDFIMYEHFITDFLGHEGGMDKAVLNLERIDAFLGALLSGLNPERFLLVLTSDHGNIEDLSCRTHTKNPVPVLAAGRGCREFVNGLTDLTGIVPRVLRALGVLNVDGSKVGRKNA